MDLFEITIFLCSMKYIIPGLEQTLEYLLVKVETSHCTAVFILCRFQKPHYFANDK